MSSLKNMKQLKEIILGMITSLAGGISSKIIVGAISYILVVLALIVLMFVNPDFPGLGSIIGTVIVTSGSLLGLTTIENIRHHNKGNNNSNRNNNEDTC